MDRRTLLLSFVAAVMPTAVQSKKKHRKKKRIVCNRYPPIWREGPVYVGNNLGPLWKEPIETAINNWNNVYPGRPLMYTEGYGVHIIVVWTEGISNTTYSTDAEGYFQHAALNIEEAVYSRPENSVLGRTEIIAHELGHAVGVHHLPAYTDYGCMDDGRKIPPGFPHPGPGPVSASQLQSNLASPEICRRG